MTNMAEIETAMFESVVAKTKNLPAFIKHERPKRECRARKRPYDLEQYSSKRPKYDQIDIDEQIDNLCTFALATSDTDEDNDTESKGGSTSDEIEQALIKQFDDNSDIEDVIEEESNPVYFTKISSDQQRHFPVVLNGTIIQKQHTLTRHSKRLISQFKYLYNHGLRKSVQPTNSGETFTNQTDPEKLRWELKNTFNRLDLFKEGYCVLSSESFPFHSLCYMCGSMGSDLIYCNTCCEAYHPGCLNEYECPRLLLPSDSWSCPNCNVCNICGLLTHETLLSRMTSEQPPLSQLISCFDCKRNFHIKCLKRLKDEQLLESNNLVTNNSNQNNSSIVSSSRLSNSYLLNETWLCPSCIKCDCGQAITSNERNILSLMKTFSSQQSLMCADCSTSLKLLRLEKNELIEKCHFCEKFIEQIYAKKSHEQQRKRNCLLQCHKCQHRFHSKCDGYLNEDADIIPQMRNLCLNIICSKCDSNERESIRRSLSEYKIEAIETILSSVSPTFSVIVSNEDHLNKLHSYVSNLQQLHGSRHHSLNLQRFLDDFLLIIRHFFRPTDIQRWQAVIDGCIIRQCPWFRSSSLLSNYSSSSSSTNHRHYQPPSTDHTYALTNETPIHSLFHSLENDSLDLKDQFNNLHQMDTRRCQLCETLSDYSLTNVGRLISFGLNQWVHVGCILPAYAKNLDQPPYILRNIRETVIRCQTKYSCVLCSKLGASVHCCENECYQRFHCDCIQKYYSTVDPTIQQQLSIKNGFLPNLTTICLRHNGLKVSNHLHRESADGTNDEDTKEMSNNHLPRFKSVNTSSTVYSDLSNSIVEFAPMDIRLCIGSLQIESLGDFDYQIAKTEETFLPHQTYPNNYRASRLFWSMKNPRQKTIYHLHIEVTQTYHQDLANHQVIAHPMIGEQSHVEQLYDTCRTYFTKFQKKIDEHLNNIEEFCQRTMVNKKGLPHPSNYRRKNATIGVGTTKRLTKGTPSCVKRQTPKAALKNVSRPRNRFANDKQPLQLPKQTLANEPNPNSLANLFQENYAKSANVSQFAVALLQALRQVGQSTKIQQEPHTTSYLLEQTRTVSSNGLTTDKSNDILLKQLLKSITTPQQLTDSQISSINASANSNQWSGSMTTQTDVTSLSKSCDEIRLNGHPQLLYSSLNGTISLPHTTDNTTNRLPKVSSLPQIDGSMDDDDEDLYASLTVINSLLDQITNQTALPERFRTTSEYSIDLSEYVHSHPSLIHVPPISPTHAEKWSKSLSSFDIIRLYQKWSKSNFSRVKFTITNDEGYQSVSENLDLAWSTVIQSIQTAREDMNLEHLAMTNAQLNGHQIFGLTKPIVKTMLSQMYTNQQPTGSVILPLSSSNTNTTSSTENLTKKSLHSSSTRTNVYERKTRERQRFGWLLNQSRKIEYALKSFEIDQALAHARRILLEEASVSLRLYHLHYFSERALLVGSSPIHGCGLFTLIDLVEGQMIIEYTGEVVRPCLTDKRERENEGKGFGCYMFTVDSMNVIDATHRGDKARFINHNCQPNCFAKTVLSGGVKHIVIYALIDVSRGSELTYDYSFPEEDVKIPCHCGTSKCRVYLN